MSYDKAFKEFQSLNNRYKFINMETDFAVNNPEKETIPELIFWADWEQDQVFYNSDEVIENLEELGRSQKQIEDMQRRAINALGKFIDKWKGKEEWV